MFEKTFHNAIRLLEDRINLEQLQTFGPEKLTGRLDVLHQLLLSFGSPETQYRTVHVAGTKGKGSVCIFTESLFLTEGKRTGTFLSPHHYSVCERIRLNGNPISEHDFTELIFFVCENIKPEILKMLSYFELLTLAALVYFAQQNVQIAVFETGLGGRLDATNVCRPDAVVITSISYDHIVQLGPTLSDIASEKCGIIKPGIPVVSAVLHPETQQTIRNKAKDSKSPVYFLGENFFVQQNNDFQDFRYAFRFLSTLPSFPTDCEIADITLSMLGSHQVRNAAIAVAVRLLLNPIFGEPDIKTVRRALNTAELPLRFEVVSRNGMPFMVFDGAHNRSSIRALIKTLTDIFPNRKYLLIFGVSLGKDVEGMVAELSGRFHHIILTQYRNNRRAFPAEGLKRIFALDPGQALLDEENDDDRTAFMEPSVMLNETIADAVLTCPLDFEREPFNQEVFADSGAALKRCLELAGEKDVICITGSIYLAAELRAEIP